LGQLPEDLQLSDSLHTSHLCRQAQFEPGQFTQPSGSECF